MLTFQPHVAGGHHVGQLRERTLSPLQEVVLDSSATRKSTNISIKIKSRVSYTMCGRGLFGSIFLFSCSAFSLCSAPLLLRCPGLPAPQFWTDFPCRVTASLPPPPPPRPWLPAPCPQRGTGELHTGIAVWRVCPGALRSFLPW